MKTLSKVVT